MSTSVIFNLEYSFVIDPKYSNPNILTYYETNNGLWKRYQSDTGSYLIIDNLNILHQVSNQINLLQQKLSTKSNYIRIIDPSVTNQFISVCCHGDEDFVTVSRQKLLSSYTKINQKSLYLHEQEFLSINEKFTRELNTLCDRYHVEVIINNDMTGASAPGYAIHILGDEDDIINCTTSLRVLVDRLLNSYMVDMIPVNSSIIPIIGGVDLVNFTQITQQTQANIYIPNLLTQSDTTKQRIYITAKHASEIILAKHIINKLLESNVQLVAQEISISKAKLDLLNLFNQQSIFKLMLKYGVFIQLASLSEDDNYTVTIRGSLVESINECINDINSITEQYYYVEASSVEMSEYDLVQMSQNQKSCIITANGNGIGVFGTNKEIVSVMETMSSYTKVQLQIELSNQHKDFISGKKNGKLIKILNQLNQLPVIKFGNYNEYSFLIDVEIFEGTDISVLIKALELIELELPAELRFNIPQVFHKSIIGNGGSIIQSIMKKYNVFIKFSFASVNTNNYSLTRGSNVLIKCPRKNAKNIELVKIELDNLVSQCCMNNQPNRATIYQSVTFQLLKQHYLLLINNGKLQQLSQIENEHNCYVEFPNSLNQFQSNAMTVSVRGSESKIRHCFTQFKSLLPNNYEFKLTLNPELFRETFVSNNQEFEEKVIIPFKILLGIELSVNKSYVSELQHHHQIILSYYNANSLQAAIHSLTSYLTEKGFIISEKQEVNIDLLIQPEHHSPLQSNVVLRPITNSYVLKMSPTREKKQILQQQQHYATSPIKSPKKTLNLNRAAYA
ncbi:uncharacterized protein SPAPADRAFT_51573 [Spathaspora passalidarum NRRL Y-27907]|uniref:K Homology domain-containing protein n=1 Tax=Spathaspora passalidarum (strain NRRL Y-27907 / 11-Y1) TaxID=619300 RepID=G3AQM9_SPAPN|nr:uncharacterized protein SPAPADRAFT_51573 [Spathaspora passalidarum NRRL Y-27907]EGW31576.1 hypothetical protein SPAPADRAFT_51573 [Spathaspora passalidarum NRRL Y-27907]